jgi:hypothetical protein
MFSIITLFALAPDDVDDRFTWEEVMNNAFEGLVRRGELWGVTL